MKNSVIAILTAMLIWFGLAIVHLENERYALEMGLCGNFEPAHPENLVAKYKCLETVQTRTSSIYHLLYGLRIL